MRFKRKLNFIYIIQQKLLLAPKDEDEALEKPLLDYSEFFEEEIVLSTASNQVLIYS